MRGWSGAIALCALLTAPASADEGMARRLAAVRALTLPQSVAPSRVAPAAGCPSPRSWEQSGYGSRARIDRAIRDASLRHAVPAALLRSLIRVESAFVTDAVSSKGALGLTQLLPATARELGVRCPFDPRENVSGGARYLRQQRDRFGSWSRALAAYHAGPSRVAAGRIPGETKRYVKQVLSGWSGAAARSARF